jgi:opacity protein-like surface antigen
MRHSSYAVVASAILLASIVPASAQTPVIWGGPYGGLSLGADFGHLPGTATAAPAGAFPGGTVNLSNHWDTSITGGGQVGYNFQFNSLVLGVEGDMKGGGPSAGTALTGGNFHAFANVGLQANYASPAPGVSGGSASNSTTLVGGTYGGGLEYAVTPNISAGVEFRHSDYGGAHLSMGAAPIAAGVSAPVTTKIDLHDDVALFKVNYRFGALPPPPPMPAAMPPPPPPAAPRVFIVFFDWDKDTITPEGHQIVQQAADAYKSGAPVQIQVTGYTDRSGSPAYNQRLSERRANNVARALSALGVPQDQMAVSGRGENDNRVPTAAGVREPQNRRVEITAP